MHGNQAAVRAGTRAHRWATTTVVRPTISRSSASCMAGQQGAARLNACQVAAGHASRFAAAWYTRCALRCPAPRPCPARLHDALALGVQRAGGLVQQQHLRRRRRVVQWHMMHAGGPGAVAPPAHADTPPAPGCPRLGVLDDGPRNGHALLLPAAQRDAALAQLRSRARQARWAGGAGQGAGARRLAGCRTGSGCRSAASQAQWQSRQAALALHLRPQPCTLVSYRSGRASMKACALAARAAASTCSSLASGRPYRMFSAWGGEGGEEHGWQGLAGWPVLMQCT